MQDSRKKSDLSLAYNAGKQAFLRSHGWRLPVVVILGIVVGNVVKAWLIAHRSFSESRAFFYATIAVLLFALTAGLIIFLWPSRKRVL